MARKGLRLWLQDLINEPLTFSQDGLQQRASRCAVDVPKGCGSPEACDFNYADAITVRCNRRQEAHTKSINPSFDQ